MKAINAMIVSSKFVYRFHFEITSQKLMAENLFKKVITKAYTQVQSIILF